MMGNGADPALPAQLDQAVLSRLLQQIAFHVVLLQIDEGRARMAAFGQEIELVDGLFAQEDLAPVPSHPLVHHALAAADAVEDVQRTLGKADRTRAGGEGVVIVHQHYADTLAGQVDGGHQPDRTGPDHHHRMQGRIGGTGLFEAGLVHETLLLVIDRWGGIHGVSSLSFLFSVLARANRVRLAVRPTFPCRARQSRCADG